MNGPAVSFLHGAEMRVAEADSADEEAESAEEKRRMHEQLDELISGAFDDLQLPEDEQSFASSKILDQNTTQGSDDDLAPTRLTNGHHQPNGHESVQLSAHYGHCTQRAAADSSAASSPAAKKRPADEQQLAALYEVRMREIGRLKHVLGSSRQEAAATAKQLAARILQLEADCAVVSHGHQQTTNLLVDAKEKITAQQEQMEHLEKQNKNLLKTKEELEQERVILLANLDSLKSQLVSLEKVSLASCNSKQAEQVVQTLQQKHLEQVATLQLQHHDLKLQLQHAAEEAKRQEGRVAQLTRDHEQGVFERAEAVNRLSRALADSQAHCQHLMATDHSNAKAQILNLRTKVQQLEQEVELQQSDLEQLETMVGLSVLTSSEQPQQLAERFQKPELQTEPGLRKQLASALRKHEAQRAQIKQQQQQLRNLEQQLHTLKTNAQAPQKDQNLRAEKERLEAEVGRLEAEVGRLEAEQVEGERAEDERRQHSNDQHKRLLEARLEAAVREGDEAKQAYLSLVSTKNAVAQDLESQRTILAKLQMQLAHNSKPPPDLEQRIAAEIENAKKEMLEEVAREKEALRTDAHLEAQQHLHQQVQQAVQAAKTEWLKAASGKDGNVSSLEAEVSKLRSELEGARSAGRREAEEQLWSHFRAELARTEQHVGADGGARRELEAAREAHAQRLAELQQLLLTKQREMDEFKQRLLQQLQQVGGGGGGVEAADLRRRLEKAKDYYERREQVICQQFATKEQHFYQVLLRLKQEVDSVHTFVDTECQLPQKL